jgi:hypothetical protein
MCNQFWKILPNDMTQVTQQKCAFTLLYYVMYKKNLGHYMPKQLLATWVMDILEPCVLRYLCRPPSGGVIGVLVHRPLAMFH